MPRDRAAECAGVAGVEAWRRSSATALVSSTRFVSRAPAIAAIISLGRSLGLSVVAEGLEAAGDVRLLRDLGCTLGQGFWYGRPQPAAEVEQLLRRAAHGELGS